MSLIEQIDNDLKDGLREGDETKKNVLRALKSAVKNTEISLGHTLSDDEIMSSIKKEIKKRHESIELYTQANRPELAATEKQEADILANYLPEQLDPTVLKSEIETYLNANPSLKEDNRGKVIGQIIANFKDKADSGTIAKIVNELLS